MKGDRAGQSGSQGKEGQQIRISPQFASAARAAGKGGNRSACGTIATAKVAGAAYAGKRRHRFAIGTKAKVKRTVGKEEAGRPAPTTAPQSMDGEMWEDYRVFKAAGMLAAWRAKWGANLS